MWANLRLRLWKGVFGIDFLNRLIDVRTKSLFMEMLRHMVDAVFMGDFRPQIRT